MRESWRFILIGIVLLILLPSDQALAGDAGWQEGDSIANLSQSGDAGSPDLALGPAGKIAVVWAGNNEKNVFLARLNEDVWLTTVLTGTESADALSPNLVYIGTQLLTVWVEATAEEKNIVQYDVDEGTSPQVVASLYGETIAPRMAVGANGVYMVFAAATSEATRSQTDLYYTYRLGSATTWISPTIAITHSQAVLPNSGQVWYPDLALSPDGDTLHVVWEQVETIIEPEISHSRTVWYTAGVWQSGEQQFLWSAPVCLSPNGQTAVRPRVTVDEAGRVHVTWVELYGGLLIRPPGQYINYRRQESIQWTDPIHIDPVHVMVNNITPTWSKAIADARGDTICVVWHGYRGTLEDTGQEETLMRCSRNGGQTWDSFTTNISETPNRLSLYPAIRIDSTGHLHIIWREYQGGSYMTNYDIYYRSGSIPKFRIYLPLVLRKS